jgi:hypothetical protein
MASEIAEAILKKHFKQKHGDIRELIDAELQEVRDVLTKLSIENTSSAGDLCWCYGDTRARSKAMLIKDEHWPICERAHALYERLVVKG